MASDFALNLKNDSDYVLTTSRWNSDIDNDATREITKRFSDAMGVTLIGDTLIAGWDGIVLAAAANQAGSTDGDAIRAAMAEGVQIDPATDPFGLEGYKYKEKNGQNEFGTAIIVQYMNSQLATVYPEGSASAEVQYPAKGWSER